MLSGGAGTLLTAVDKTHRRLDMLCYLGTLVPAIGQIVKKEGNW